MDEAQPTAQEIPTTTNTGGVKETIESILVAFILAFIFRAFIVEAFVIPTGSMAPTLMGAHLRFQCPDCGYRYDVNYSTPNQGDDTNIPSNAGNINTPIYCPNCGFRADPSQVANPPVYYGDRILVLKYLYLFQPPRRWDVVVFKAPVEPQKYNYGQNYIKRLIGKPNEAIMLLDGDVYIREPDAKDAKDFVVQPKPKDVQDALWRIVYDNDYHPQMGLDRAGARDWKQPWTPIDGSGWKLDDPATHGRTFTFDNTSGVSTLRFDPSANATSHSLSDYLVYDVPMMSKHPNDVYPEPYETPVSDLNLRTSYQRTAGDGPLSLALSKREHRFVAVITPTDASLFHEFNNKRVQIGQSFAIPKSDQPLSVELSNADYQVTLRINRQVVAQTTPAEYAPDIPQLLNEYEQRTKPPVPQVQIIADHQSCRLSHVSLWRDVYYYNGSPVDVRWATPADFPNNAQVLKSDEYFVMGDNSLLSFDARCWQKNSYLSAPPIDLPDEDLYAAEGRVPGRFLLGKAFFVYWPAGYQPLSGWPAVVPNFGDMRFIH
jgi:signal peptidase I